jgi:outer membrane protein assembly factor BamA
VLAILFALALFGGQSVERVTAVRVQGNTLTADADVVRMSGVQVGAEVTPGLLEKVAARLKSAGHFERVEVLKRYASIADPSQILLVIVVDEGRVVVQPAKNGQPARAVKKRGPPLMFLPLFGYPEGYGFTYGALVSMPDVAGPRTRVSIPLTWGGERHAGVELEKRLDTPRLTRLRVGGAVLSRENPAYNRTDERQQAWVRGEREFARALRLGAWGGYDAVSFSGQDSRVVRTGGDATFDTRIDPMLSRRAVYVRGGVERLDILDQSAAIRTAIDASGYVGGPGSSTIVLRVVRDGTNASVPPYLKVLLGRNDTLRGYPSGYATGDSTASGQVELRVPLTPPLRFIKAGVRTFVDAATVYDAGEQLQDQHFEHSVGAGVWLTVTAVRVALDVAHGANGSTRLLLSSALLF